jgi:formate dehydrogenase
MKTVQLGTPDHLRDSARRARKQVKGRVPDAQAMAAVQSLLGQAPVDGYPRDLLIEHLHLLQDAHGALHKAHLVALAQVMRMGLAQVYEVASFYHHFHILEDGPAPRLTLRVCNGLSCTLAGADDLFQQLQAQMDPGVQVLHAPCVGRCEAAPVAVVHQRAVGHANLGSVQACVAAGSPPEAPLSAQAWPQAPLAWCEPVHPERLACAEYVAAGGYRLLADVAAGRVAAASVLQTMEDSGLRGLGGAGFPLGRKWRIVRDQPAPKLMAVNIDEGEPGTFKDRTYLERDPHRFLEGMLVAAQVVGIDACYIYLRDEYHGCRAILEHEIAALQANPPCPLPTIY